MDALTKYVKTEGVLQKRDDTKQQATLVLERHALAKPQNKPR